MDWIVVNAQTQTTTDTSKWDALIRTIPDIGETLGNTYRDLYEQSSMRSGIIYVVVANMVTAIVGLLIYRAFLFKQSLLTDTERELVEPFSKSSREQIYIPSKRNFSHVPPERYQGIQSIFRAQHNLSTDAKVYLQFQRLCIQLVFVAGLFSCIVLMPAYYFGASHSKYGRAAAARDSMSLLESTTAHHIPQQSWILLLLIPFWLTVSGLVFRLYAFISRSTVRDHSLRQWIINSAVRNENRWTVIIKNLPLGIQHSDEVIRVLNARYPDKVVSAELMFKEMGAVQALDDDILHAELRVKYFEEHPQEPNHLIPPLSLLYQGLQLLNPDRLRKGESVLDYHKRKLSELKAERDIILESKTSLHMAFVTFNTPEPVEELIADSRDSTITIAYARNEVLLPTAFWRLFRPERQTAYYFESEYFYGDVMRDEKYSEFLRVCHVMPAPPPEDIIFTNLTIGHGQRVLREVLVELLVLFALTLFSSPVAMIAGTKQGIIEAANLAGIGGNSTSPHGNGFGFPSPISPKRAEEEAKEILDALLSLLPDIFVNNPVLSKFILVYFPVFLLTVINASVPTLLRLTSNIEGCLTRSAQEVSVFRKTVFYVILNTVILPSLAMDTASEIALELYKRTNDFDFGSVTFALPVFERIFSGDIVFFLCSFIVQLTGTGALFSLLRLPGHIQRIYMQRRAVTPLEKAEAKVAETFDYPYNYAYTIAVLCMCLLFGGIAPIIWLFALVFFLVKHEVDMFNIRFIHPPLEMEGSMHRDAATLVVFWCAISQLLFAGSLYFRGFYGSSLLMVLIGCVTIIFWVSYRSVSKQVDLPAMETTEMNLHVVSYGALDEEDSPNGYELHKFRSFGGGKALEVNTDLA
mmetsp:Transcript_12749/g.21818  ORF Transcript_12749/g.21818 Transcript_12749/m.21818 type:complete len:865 (+) Transcript_12749:145-2739(+)